MRIVFVAAPLQGHLLPLVPLAAACRDAGHDVTLASGGFPPDVRGLRTADIGGGFNLPRSAIRVALRHPGLARAEMRGRAGHGFVGELFGRANLALLGPLQALAERERPDLIVYESLSEAGAVVAGRLGIPSVLQENTLWPADELYRAVTGSSALTRLGAAAPALTLAVTPPSLRTPVEGAQPMRPVPFSGGGAIPPWLTAPGDKPRILVSRSTLEGPSDGNPGPAVIAAAADVDAEIVLVRPARDGALPANVRSVGRVPLDELLPYAAGFVHHSGAGSVLGGLAAGVPQLTTPGAGDRRYNSGLLARRGAGLAVAADAITAADLNRLISDEGLRAAAREVAAEIAGMPSPESVVGSLEKLAG
ncbi:glycosyl transferase [Paractinoplanes abujensis]|uniref:UDP:flavonoid glycosyltransferase YjiC (YdhE family) n=1 Tax=Paractinoplanes abujensis TaxID=882441 RepID=A0A7W7CQT0_9ACTN|nr:nucleotide disphospho-sugar-binding domain-containing protein [Actinoplanes abujensis]MBB4691563.1 UDP:flavonoid glycosyltransferase YjiC (YdhE family) [Actinoplanes abujensis]GID17019.1 glycosyl transferase [Actinoplanes abujensis]